MRLVDDDRVVAAQQPVALDLGQQDAVGHQLDQGGVADPVGEPDRVADRLADLGAEFLGDPLGDRPGRDPARLGVPDHARARRGPVPGTSWAAGWSCPIRSRRRRRPPGARRSPSSRSSPALADRQVGAGSRSPAPLPGAGRSRCSAWSRSASAPPAGPGRSRPGAAGGRAGTTPAGRARRSGGGAPPATRLRSLRPGLLGPGPGRSGSDRAAPAGCESAAGPGRRRPRRWGGRDRPEGSDLPDGSDLPGGSDLRAAQTSRTAEAEVARAAELARTFALQVSAGRRTLYRPGDPVVFRRKAARRLGWSSRCRHWPVAYGSSHSKSVT